MFDFLEEILREFKDVPGLSFLRRFLDRLIIFKDRFRRKTDRVRVLHNSVKGTKRSLQRMRDKSRSSKRRNAE